MRTREQILEMLHRFDDAISSSGIDDDDMDDDTRAAWDVLCWVADEDRPDDLVTDYLPVGSDENN